MSALSEIARKRYETGAYSNSHLRMTRAALAALCEQIPPPPTFGLNPLGQLMSIPIRIDESVPAGEWQLADNALDAVIRTGRIDE